MEAGTQTSPCQPEARRETIEEMASSGIARLRTKLITCVVKRRGKIDITFLSHEEQEEIEREVDRQLAQAVAQHMGSGHLAYLEKLHGIDHSLRASA